MKKASSIFEYGILVAIVVAAMLAMHHTTKRTINASIRGLTDEYIGPQGGDSSSWLEKGVDSREGYTESEYYLSKDEAQDWQSRSNRDSEAIDYSVKPPLILYPEVTVDGWYFDWEPISDCE